MKKLTGWGTGKNENNPFNREQYKKSYVKKSLGSTYEDYLRDYAKIKTKRKQKTQRKMTQTKKPYDSVANFLGRY